MSFPDQDAGSGTSTLGHFNLVVAIHATASALIKFQIGEKGAFELVKIIVKILGSRKEPYGDGFSYVGFGMVLRRCDVLLIL